MYIFSNFIALEIECGECLCMIKDVKKLMETRVCLYYIYLESLVRIQNSIESLTNIVCGYE